MLLLQYYSPFSRYCVGHPGGPLLYSIHIFTDGGGEGGVPRDFFGSENFGQKGFFLGL